jgi:hypothetical protein
VAPRPLKVMGRIEAHYAKCAQVSKADLIGHDPATALSQFVATAPLPRPATGSFVKAASRYCIPMAPLTLNVAMATNIGDIGAVLR